MDSMYRPLPFGQLLDRGLQVYRKHFVQLVLLTLGLFGPVYLFYAWIISRGMEADDAASPWSRLSDSYTADPVVLQEDSIFLIMAVIVLALIVSAVLVPVAMGAITAMVEAAYEGRELEPAASLKRAFKRALPLAGNTILYVILSSAAYTIVAFGLIIVIIPIALVIGLGGSLLSLSFSPGLILVVVLLYVALTCAVSAVMAYFFIRFGYYIPVVVLEKEGMGLGRSWELTKGSFWRLFFIYTVLSLIVSVFYLVGFIAIEFLVPVMILRVAITALCLIVLTPMLFVVYSVTYFDLKVRREGVDLERVLQRLNAGLSAEQLSYGSTAFQPIYYGAMNRQPYNGPVSNGHKPGRGPDHYG